MTGYAARPAAPLRKSARQHERYGAINTDVKAGSKAWAALEHTAGTPVGMVMGWRHQGRANKLRRELGGSPERTPSDLKGRASRILGTITGGSASAAVSAAGGGLLGAGAGGLAGFAARGPAGAAIGALMGGNAGAYAGGGLGTVKGAIAGHRRVRDSQIWRRDFEKAAADEMRDERLQAIPLAKGWREKLPAILDAVRAIQEAEAAGMGDELHLDAEDVLNLVNRVVAHVRKRGEAAVAKSADPTLDTLMKGAPDILLLEFADLAPEAQQDILGAGDALLAELDALHKAAGGEGRDALQKRAIDMDRLMRGAGDPELVKFWGGVAAAAGRVAPQIGQAAMRWAGTIRGTMGPRLSALVGSSKAGAQRLAGRVADFARGPAQGSLDLRGGGTGGIAGMGRRAWAGAQGYARQAWTNPAATGRAAAAGLGRHVYANRGGYGLAAGMEVQRRWGGQG